jgi:hypothetical protein
LILGENGHNPKFCRFTTTEKYFPPFTCLLHATGWTKSQTQILNNLSK